MAVEYDEGSAEKRRMAPQIRPGSGDFNGFARSPRQRNDDGKP
jgi:hypothetical protein